MSLSRSISLFLLLVSGISFHGCLNCVECNKCKDASKNTEEICYDEAKPYYRSRVDWRQDVKAYESQYDCDCK